MEALWANYGSDSEDSVDFSLGYGNINSSPTSCTMSNPNTDPILLPPPPVELLQPPNSADLSIFQGDRVRSFPHVAGNYSLHIFIPVTVPVVTRKQLASSIKRISSVMASLFVVDLDVALSELCQDNGKLEQVLFGREFHISLGRTVPIKVHQIDSIVSMLRHRLQFQKRYWMEFNKWDAFVNDELTRSFLSLEVTGVGLNEISKQISVVDEIYRLHGLPEFYKNPRPHISLLWALGDVSNLLKPAADELNKLNGPSGRHIFSCKFNEISCRIGKKLYNICKLVD